MRVLALLLHGGARGGGRGDKGEGRGRGELRYSPTLGDGESGDWFIPFPYPNPIFLKSSS